MSEIADIISIIGFIITIWTFIKIWDNTKQLRELNKKNFFINRLPDNLKDLKKSSSKISILISNIDGNKNEILVEISNLSPILKSTKKSLKDNDLEHYKLLETEVNKHKITFVDINNVNWFRKFFNQYNILDENYARNIYRYLTTFITDIENMNKDFKKDLLK
ncbi:hypothetical protein L0669_13370 [Flavobacterium bizetiae]|uniref:hypothetical protein n=1 Tax=Flavobacterium bizetiae TaxID=2704140 RepID=UPI0021E92235|nr:hypothetical protein [Flavobacterium bizetiae]UTN02309.1 hypothetical protein L0669_13370 [Flavobacterium bizetiae]